MRKTNKLLLVLCAVAIFVAGWAAGSLFKLPFVKQVTTNWAIGIYTGDSPLELTPGWADNPVLTAEDVTDARATFVADPFLAQENGTWYMFLEVLNADTDHGDIAYATSPDGRDWTYQRIVLDEPFHVTYPYVFQWEGEWYMLPETTQANEVRLYKAARFPIEWSYAGTLLEGAFLDSSILFYDDMWWLFTSPTENASHRMRLYYSKDLLGPWKEHPASPIVDWNANIARSGGRIIVHDGRIIRFAQDCHPSYGLQVYAIEVTELTPATYREQMIGNKAILSHSDHGWNARTMHHVDPHLTADGTWIASVDARGRKRVLALRFR